MDKISIQQSWKQLEDTLFCGDCRSCRLIIWEKDSAMEKPRDSKVLDDIWYAVHCDYFKRRVENPSLLQRCGAHQKNGGASVGG